MAKFHFKFGGEKPSFTSIGFWTKVLIMSLSIIITTQLFSFAKISGFTSAILAAILISLLNAFIKPILVLFSLPIMVLSLGLFNLVLNALIILFADFLLGDRFNVNGFTGAFLFSIIITLIASLLEIPEKIRRVKKQFKEGMNQGNINNKDNDIESGFTDYEDISDEDK